MTLAYYSTKEKTDNYCIRHIIGGRQTFIFFPKEGVIRIYLLDVLMSEIGTNLTLEKFEESMDSLQYKTFQANMFPTEGMEIIKK